MLTSPCHYKGNAKCHIWVNIVMYDISTKNSPMFAT